MDMLSRSFQAGLAGLVGLLLLAASPVAVAQSLGETSADEVEARFTEAARLSGQDKLNEAERYLAAMSEILKRGFETLAEAREEKDLVRMNCVNEKLGSQKGLLKISEQAHIQLQDAVARGDKASANHEFTKIAIAYQKMRGLGVEVEGCAGEALRYAGDTKLEVVVDGDIEEEDPTADPVEEVVLDVHPEAASPFK